MKKGKIISMPTGVDAQIRARARNLPIDKCYINPIWEEAQMADIIVTRKHVNGNITYGLYLVDLLLLGVKDCSYDFNVSPMEVEERLFNDAFDIFVECDYELAHNIIYESVAFAKDFGFDPVKDFTKTGIYILEEDSDAIPQMDIPLGDNGVPMVFINSENDMKHEIAILEKTAGHGNFIVYNEDDDDDLDDDDDDDFDGLDDDDDDDDWNYEEVVDEVYEMGIYNYIAEYGVQLSLIQRLAVTDVSYETVFEISDSEVDEVFQLIYDDDRFDTDLERIPGLENYFDQLQSIVDKTVDNADAALSDLEALIAEHPDILELSILHISLLCDMKKMSEVERLTLYWYDRTPNHYIIRLFYARWLIEQERFDEMFELFGNLPGLDALTTENLTFTDTIVSEFCACYVLAWLSKNNIEKAEPYYQLLHELVNRTSIVQNAIIAMFEKKTEAIREKIPELMLKTMKSD